MTNVKYPFHLFLNWNPAYSYCSLPEGYTGETVMMAPAAGFYSTPNLGKNQVRMAYVLKTEDLGRSLLVLEKALEAYKK